MWQVTTAAKPATQPQVELDALHLATCTAGCRELPATMWPSGDDDGEEEAAAEAACLQAILEEEEEERARER